MEKMCFDKKNVHLIGIGGISMSGLAKILLDRGVSISGSDSQKSELLKNLEASGATVFYGHNADNITKDIDLVVHSAAICDTNPEMQKATKLGIKIIDRAQLLGAILKEFKYPICISGTHGKTTTTSMVSDMLLQQNVDPTLSVGGILSSIGSNFKMGSYDYFVAESCEYSDSFLKFYPYVGLILNVEYDHTDYFESLEHVQTSFNSFAKNISDFLIIDKNILGYEKIVKDIAAKIITFGETGDFYATNIEFKPMSTNFTLNYFAKTQDITLIMPGEYNVHNALAALACIYALGLSVEKAAQTLKSFKGVERRYQLKGTLKGATIIDDYAHHPTEIKKSLSVKNPVGDKICVFQPHTYSRTIAFLDDFAEAFELCDTLILLDIYAAREIDEGIINSKILAEKIKQNAKSPKEVIYCQSFLEAEQLLLNRIKKDDLIITMGAGFAHEVGESLLRVAH